ncbi:helix-turn-helix transcriptional regulator [Mucilaginibacter sabulilitoris]|uniref:Helix-turn-helix transcriptional regulator n=1 Tax=Mucilaginibacter sabulilitoris TaxID=1173583 RepID=A0ABZ0TUW5_9SPHI|nr:helix-turn-helix transcriptional regulator [Mucilaginibacter sabulilitoris]WPU95584.1 helix-turn-helix transcriptional regulator [Mucilaginibacter sabulilitoris]
MNIGQNIRALRREKGWSQEEVSKRLDISIPAFSKIETGVTDINLSRLEQIAAIFETTVARMLTQNDDHPEKPGSKLDTLSHQLMIRETEVISLQNKLIELFEELRKTEIKPLTKSSTVGA